MESKPQINQLPIIKENKFSYPSDELISSTFNTIRQQMAVLENGGDISGIPDTAAKIISLDIVPKYIKDILFNIKSPGDFKLDDFMIEKLRNKANPLKDILKKLELNGVEEALCLTLLDEVQGFTQQYYKNLKEPDDTTIAYDKATDIDFINAVANGDKPISSVNYCLLNLRAILLNKEKISTINYSLPTGTINGITVYDNSIMVCQRAAKEIDGFEAIDLMTQANEGTIPMDANYHRKIGKLFGYTPEQIENYITSRPPQKTQTSPE